MNACLVKFILLVLFSGAAGCASNHKRPASGICEIHDTKMKARTIPISYGLMIGNYLDQWSAMNKASQTAFPHAEDYISGGCIVKRFSPHRARVFECAGCRETKTQWQAEFEKTNAAAIPKRSYL